MIQLTAQTRIFVAIKPADFRCGIDGLARIARDAYSQDPFSGCVFVFRNRRKTAVKILSYDGQGFWLCQKRLSTCRFKHWPDGSNTVMTPLEAHELSVLVRGGDPSSTQAAPVWRSVAIEA